MPGFYALLIDKVTFSLQQNKLIRKEERKYFSFSSSSGRGVSLCMAIHALETWLLFSKFSP